MEEQTPIGVNLAKALLKARSHTAKGAKKNASNPHFKTKYADLNAILDLLDPALEDAGLVLLQPPMFVGYADDEKRVMGVRTILIHAESGEQLAFDTVIPPAKMNDPQAQGGAFKYARRYALSGLFSLSDDDDDGETAMGRGRQQPTRSAFVRDEEKPGAADSQTIFEEDNELPALRPPSRVPTPRPQIRIGSGDDDAPSEPRAPIAARPAIPPAPRRS